MRTSVVIALLLLGLGSDASAAPPYLVADINTLPVGSRPEEVTALGNEVYLSADDGVHGRELWRSDGTIAGTRLVADLCPGPCSSDPKEIVELNGVVYFMVTDSIPETSWGLWRTDGTVPGTWLVHPRIGRELTVFENALYFVSNGLWRSDGTTAGTRLLKQTLKFSVTALTVSGPFLYFDIWASGVGVELWRTDGTASGTQLVADINPGPTGSGPTELTDVGGTLFFVAYEGVNGVELWRSDGTAVGTRIVADIHASGSSFPAELTTSGGSLFFAADDGVSGRELWKSDGLTVSLLSDVEPGLGGLGPWGLVDVGGRLVFVARANAFGVEPWVSDGTVAGTRLLLDINPGVAGSLPFEPGLFRATSGLGHFLADDGVDGYDPWVTDGTTAGTRRVQDTPGLRISIPIMPDWFAASGGKHYFRGRQGTEELWVSDGVDATLLPINQAGSLGSEPSHLTSWRGEVVFAADDGIGGRELFRSDGTPGGTFQIKDTCPGVCSGILWSEPHRGDYERPVPVVGGNLFYSATSGGSEGLWRSDGTGPGTFPLSSARAYVLGELRGEAFFFDSGMLWRSDGTLPGTVPVTSVSPNAPLRFGTSQNALFMASWYDLWGGDGTATGTRRLFSPPARSSIEYLAAVSGDRAYFIVRTEQSWKGILWTTDGTLAGTMPLNVVASSLKAAGTFQLGNGEIMFGGYDPLWGQVQEPWMSDGTPGGTRRLLPAGALVGPGWTISTGSRIFFVAHDRATGAELWVTDGSSAGTHLVKDISAGVWDTPISNLAAHGGRVLFTADHWQTGRELWLSDGTDSGTRIVGEIHPGSQGLTHVGQPAIVVGNRYYFINEDYRGKELWAYDVPPTASGLLRSIELVSVDPVTPPLASVLPLDPTRDSYVPSFPSGETDVPPASAPLVFYEIEATATVYLSEGSPGEVRIDF